MKIKTKILFAVLLLMMIGGLMACEDYLDNPPVTKYTVEAFAIDGMFTPSKVEVYKGGKTTLTLKPNDGYDPDSAYKNGVVDESLRGKTTFNFSNINSDIKVKAVCKINKWGILMNGPWKTARWQRRLKSEPTIWELDKYPPNIAVDIVTFDVLMMKIVDSDGFIVGNSEYQFTGDSLFRKNGLRYKVVELSEKTLIIEHLSRFVVSPGVFDPTRDRIVRITYTRE